jgi:hypothetical protein
MKALPKTIVVSTCNDCPAMKQNSEYPETTCGIARRTWGMGHYEGGPAPTWCPLRQADAVIILK